MTRPRTALVTGAARGQGLAIVRRLLRDGYAVAACDVREDELVAAAADLDADRLLTLVLDVTSTDDWASAVETVEQTFGGLDALVNNAGVLHRAPIAEEDPADFERVWRVNCLGPFLGIQACLPLLLRGTEPAIVNTISSSGFRPYPRHAGYGASKWAARGLSLSAAAELSSLGIRVNAVMPGAIATPMIGEGSSDRLAPTVLLGRVGEADEVASVVAFLLSADASYMTGAELLVDGGQLLRIQT